MSDVPGFDYDCYVRFSDVDVYGHVNNVKYYEYYQEARIDLVRSLRREPEDPLLELVVARLDVDYRRPMLFRAAPYRITSRVTQVGTSSFRIASEIHDADALYSRAEAVMVAFDGETQSARPLTELQRRRLMSGIVDG